MTWPLFSVYVVRGAAALMGLLVMLLGLVWYAGEHGTRWVRAAAVVAGGVGIVVGMALLLWAVDPPDGWELTLR